MRSVVVGICTAGRSNQEPTSDNPLAWVLAGIAAQDHPIGRVHVLKHGAGGRSFEDLLARFARSLPLTVERWPRRAPLSMLRNRLVALAGRDLLYVLDDDAVPYGESTLSRLVQAHREAGPEAAVVQGAVLRRTIQGRPLLRGQGEVAQLRLREGVVTHAFDRVREPGRDPAGPGEVDAFEIGNLCLAQCLLDPAWARRAGGFRSFPWPAIYGQESDLGARISAAGGRLLYVADLAAAVVHLKHGAPCWALRPPEAADARLAGGTRFREAARLSAVSDGRSWSRRPGVGFYSDYVAGLGSIFLAADPAGFACFMARVGRDLVAGNSMLHPCVLPLELRAERERAVRLGLQRLRRVGLAEAALRQHMATIRSLETAAPPGAADVTWL